MVVAIWMPGRPLAQPAKLEDFNPLPWFQLLPKGTLRVAS